MVVGDRVVMRPNTRYEDQDTGGPGTVTEIILEDLDHDVHVDWDNGECNFYSSSKDVMLYSGPNLLINALKL